MSSKKKTKKKKGKLKLLKKLLTFFIIILIIVVAAAAAAVWYIDSKMNMLQKVEIDKSEISVSENENLAGYRNIAIFGVDSRDNSYEKGNRTDCIIIASINNKTHDVKLISLYRDTYVKIDKHGFDKLTHAYSYGKAPLAIKTINENLDLNITEFVTVNFEAVVEAINELGGLEMEITDEEAKYINPYIDELNWVTEHNSPHITKGGKYTLDGVQAVGYTRIRYTAGGDYKRTERLRTVLTLMMEKAKTKNVLELNKIADKVLPKVYTNLSTKDILSMAPSLTSFSVSESMGWPYEVKSATIGGIWYGPAADLEADVEKLHKEVFEDEEYVAPESVKKISDQIKTKIKNKK